MLYIATVHWKDSRWIKLQREFLDRYISEPFSVFTYLTDIPAKFNTYFDHIRDQADPSHAEKLNILAQDIIQASKSDEDIIIFLDGDAFPIAPLVEKIRQYLLNFNLVAVKRLENRGDIQPHPCFGATTTGFWKKYNPNWKEGFEWKNNLGEPTTDVGAGVLELLLQRQIPWKALLRSNVRDLHPVLFGIYDDLIYHHGAGFRKALVRQDLELYKPVKRSKMQQLITGMIPLKIKRLLYVQLVEFKKKAVIRSNNALSMEVYHALETNAEKFIDTLRARSRTES